MENGNTRLLQWEAENLTVFSYFVAYIGGVLTVSEKKLLCGAACARNPTAADFDLRYWIWSRWLSVRAPCATHGQ